MDRQSRKAKNYEIEGCNAEVESKKPYEKDREWLDDELEYTYESIIDIRSRSDREK